MTWLTLDYGGVICHPQSKEDLTGLAELAGRPWADLEPAYWAHRLDYDRADLDGVAYWQKVAAVAGVVVSEAQIAALIALDTRSWLNLRPEMVSLIEEAAAAGARLALLSNAPAEVAAAVAALPVARHFEHLAFSCDLRSAKPDLAYYRAVLERLGAGPGEAVFLDDRPENVAAAVAAGLRGVRFTDPAQARAALVGHGVLAGRSAPAG